jgi:hypothetical protein
MRWYGYVSRMNKERIPKKRSRHKSKGKCPEGKPRSRWELSRKICHPEGRKIMG